jgi:hypothetical protein
MLKPQISPGTICPVRNVVIGRKPLRVFGVPHTEDEHSARLGEAAGVATWGPIWLEKGAAGSFTGVNLGFNGTGGSLSADLVDEVMKATGGGDVGEGMKGVIKGFGFDPDDQNVWEWVSELLDGMRNDTECFTMEPCIQMWSVSDPFPTFHTCTPQVKLKSFLVPFRFKIIQPLQMSA